VSRWASGYCALGGVAQRQGPTFSARWGTDLMGVNPPVVPIEGQQRTGSQMQAVASVPGGTERHICAAWPQRKNRYLVCEQWRVNVRSKAVLLSKTLYGNHRRSYVLSDLGDGRGHRGRRVQGGVTIDERPSELRYRTPRSTRPFVRPLGNLDHHQRDQVLIEVVILQVSHVDPHPSIGPARPRARRCPRYLTPGAHTVTIRPPHDRPVIDSEEAK
jgi:hypothetical protein